MRRLAVPFLVLTLSFGAVSWGDLLSYVNTDDGAYKWEIESQSDLGLGVKLYDLKLISQVWQGITWQHSLRVVLPQNAQKSTLALLLITGSGKGDEELQYGKMISMAIKAPVVVLHDVPYQPLFGGLREDELISYTFAKFLETQDETWPLLLPMAKSAVKAMDAVQELAEKELGMKVTGFVVTGASKRGWTTWLSAAVDKRVKAIAPMVYDNLNLEAQMNHQLETWGDFSEQIDDYTRRELPQMLVEGKMGDFADKLQNLVDPYRHRQRITVPKLIIIGTNDRYWPLDALNIYWKDLIGEKYILYDPNSGHGLEDRDRVLSDIICFFLKTAGELEFPDLRWEFDDTEDKVILHVVSHKVKPTLVQAWVAKSPTRDFREVRWESFPMSKDEKGVYRFELERPQEGYAAMFGEAVYRTDDGKQFFLSTQVVIFKRVKKL